MTRCWRRYGTGRVTFGGFLLAVVAYGLLYTFTQSGAAVGTGGSPDACRAALIVPVVVVLPGTAACAPPDPPPARRPRRAQAGFPRAFSGRGVRGARGAGSVLPGGRPRRQGR
ncbi:hypothetical protein GCM10009678_18430 [Actinomadura kijaniata]